MNIKRLLADFAITFVINLVVVVAVTFLWNLIIHRAGTVDWETAFQFAIILGIVLPLVRAQEKGTAEKWK